MPPPASPSAHRARCAADVRVVALSDTSFAVATTIGLAIVSVADGEVSLKSMSLLLGFQHHQGMLVNLPMDANGLAACHLADMILDGPALVWAQQTTAMVGASPTRLIAARGQHLFDVNVADLGGPELRDSLKTGVEMGGLTINEGRDRAYGVGRSGPQSRAPIIDLRGAEMVVTGQHSLASWVQRKDAAGLTARVMSNGNVLVARVAR